MLGLAPLIVSHCGVYKAHYTHQKFPSLLHYTYIYLSTFKHQVILRQQVRSLALNDSIAKLMKTPGIYKNTISVSLALFLLLLLQAEVTHLPNYIQKSLPTGNDSRSSSSDSGESSRSAGAEAGYGREDMGALPSRFRCNPPSTHPTTGKVTPTVTRREVENASNVMESRKEGKERYGK